MSSLGLTRLSDQTVHCTKERPCLNLVPLDIVSLIAVVEVSGTHRAHRRKTNGTQKTESGKFL